MSQLIDEQVQLWAAELSGLHKKQAEALQLSSYVNMTKEEALAYDERRARITELSIRLGKVRPPL